MKIKDLQDEDLDERFIQSLSETLDIMENAIREHLKLGEGILDNLPNEYFIKKREFVHRKLIEDEK